MEGSVFAQGNSIPDASTVTLESGTLLRIGTSSETIGGLAGSGGVLIGNGAELTVGGNNANTTFSGTISPTSLVDDAVTKTGFGVLTLTGASTYTGLTTIDAGTLMVSNNAGSATGTSNVTVNPGGTLAGTGSVAGAVTVNPGGFVAPGDPVGQLTVGGLTLSTSTTFDLEIAAAGTPGTDYDQLVVNGTADLGGIMEIALLGGFVPTALDIFTVLTSTGLTGTFHNLPDGSRIVTTGGEGSFLISYDTTANAVLLSSFLAAITGDYNGSGQVEQGDLDLVLLNWGRDTDTTGIPTGWINDLPEGQIEQTELDGVLLNWGGTAAPGFRGAVAPEPQAALLLSVCAAACRRRR